MDSTTSVPGKRSGSAKRRFTSGVIVGVALVVRLLIVWLALKAHGAQWFFGQASELGRLAESLCDGHGLSSPFGGATGASAFLAPGYPLFVAAVFLVFGKFSMASAIVLAGTQAVFGAATAALIVLLARQVCDVTTASIAGVVWAISPPALFLPLVFWESSISILLAAGLINLGLRLTQDAATRVWISYGALTALAMMVNPALLPIAIACAVYAAWKAHRAAALAIAMLTCITLCMPWSIRNAIVLHAFVPLRSNAGYELWQGNRPGGDGFFHAAFHLNTNAAEFADYKSHGELNYMRAKSTIARQAIKGDVRRFIRLTLQRAVSFWTGLGGSNSSLVVAYLCCGSLLGWAGCIRLLQQQRSTGWFFLWPLILFPLPYYVTHPDSRFRLILDPLLITLSVYLVHSIGRQVALSPRNAEVRDLANSELVSDLNVARYDLTGRKFDHTAHFHADGC